MHALSTPPAFVLSQDQTLQRKDRPTEVGSPARPLSGAGFDLIKGVSLVRRWLAKPPICF